MKKSLVCNLFFAFALCCVVSVAISAQTTSPGVSEQKFQELINEVRQLRIEVQRLNASAQRTQLLLERSRTQQEIVSRLTQRLSDTRDEIGKIRKRQVIMKESLANAEKQKEAGVQSEAESKAINAELNGLSQQEQTLLDRELQVSSELEAERANLNDLKTRLDKLEQEIATPSSEPAKKRE